MCGTEKLVIVVRFAHWQTENPLKFATKFADEWEKAGRDSLSFYENRTPLPPTEFETLTQKVSFEGAFKTKPQRTLTLKSSLKQNGDIVYFVFENTSFYWRGLHPLGWGNVASQLRIEILLDKVNTRGEYAAEHLAELLVSILSKKKGKSVFVFISAEGYLGRDGVEAELQRLRIANKNFFIWSWLNLFPVEEYNRLDNIFRGMANFEDFCKTHDMDVLFLPNKNGKLVKMKGTINDSPEFYAKLLKINRDFYELLE